MEQHEECGNDERSSSGSSVNDPPVGTDGTSDDEYMRIRRSILETVVIQQQKRISELERKIKKTRSKINILQEETTVLTNHVADHANAMIAAGPTQYAGEAVGTGKAGQKIASGSSFLQNGPSSPLQEQKAIGARPTPPAPEKSPMDGVSEKPPSCPATIAVEVPVEKRSPERSLGSRGTGDVARTEKRIDEPTLRAARPGSADEDAREDLEGNQSADGSHLENLREAVERSDQKQTRYWTAEEHERFLRGVRMHGDKNYTAISKIVITRTPKQVRTHAQKFQKRLEREASKKRFSSSSFPDTQSMASERLRSQDAILDDATTKTLLEIEANETANVSGGLSADNDIFDDVDDIEITVQKRARLDARSSPSDSFQSSKSTMEMGPSSMSPSVSGQRGSSSVRGAIDVPANQEKENGKERPNHPSTMNDERGKPKDGTSRESPPPNMEADNHPANVKDDSQSDPGDNRCSGAHTETQPQHGGTEVTPGESSDRGAGSKHEAVEEKMTSHTPPPSDPAPSNSMFPDELRVETKQEPKAVDGMDISIPEGPENG